MTREINPDITNPSYFNESLEREVITRKFKKKAKIHRKIMKRYKEHNFKPKKSKDPNLDERPFYVTSEKQIKKYKLQKYIPHPDDPEVEDEIIKK